MSTTSPLAGRAVTSTTHLPSLDGLRARSTGAVLTPDDAAYPAATSVWNLAYRHHAAVVVVPATANDVVEAVRYAGAADLPVAVQATGHGIGLPADGGLLIVMSELAGVAVDADAWTARIEGGAKWERVLPLAVGAGLAPLLGSTPDVGAVGYTLGGGMGWFARRYGLSSDHVRAIEVVTADGELRRVTADTDADLFWALRGGGAGSLGVVTAIEIDLMPITSMYAGNLLYPAAIAREVAARYRDWITDAPDELTSSLSFMNFPPLDDVPAPIRGQSFAIVRGAFLGSDDDGRALLDHWRSWREPTIDSWGRMPFADVALISNDPVDPMPGMSSTEWLVSLDDGAIDALARASFEHDGPSPLTFVEIRHAGGAISRSPSRPSAYSQRHEQYLLQMVGVAGGPELVALERFVADLRTQLSPWTTGGAYLNFLEGEEKVARTRSAFDAATWERLVAIKRRFDPNGRFRHGLALAGGV